MNTKIFRAAILTPYLLETMEDIIEIVGTESAKREVELYGFNPENFSNQKALTTQAGKTVRIERHIELQDHPDITVIGCTSSVEKDVQDLKGSGLLIARYSIFYGEPSGYTGNTPEESGYALDIPKDVTTVKALLTDDASLEAIASKNYPRIIDALSTLNKRLHEPILTTPYLEEITLGNVQ